MNSPPVSDPNLLLRSLLGASGDCIKILDLDGKLIFMTEGGQRVMEVTDVGAIIGCPWPDFWRDKGNTDATAAVETARAGGTANFQGFATTMAGTPKWWDVNVTPIFGADGKPEKILSISRDITASRLADQALAASEAQLRLALNAGRLGHWTLDLKTGEMTASDICKEVFGRNRADTFTYQELRGAVHPDDRPRLKIALKRTLASGEDYDVEYRFIRPDGSIGWVMIRGQLVRSGDGKPAAMSGVSIDISALKLAEQTLLQSEAQFRTFAQAMPNQVWAATPEGKLDWFNDQVFQFSGLEFDALKGDGWAQIVHSEDIAGASLLWADALASAMPYQTQFRLRRADGIFRWHISRALPIKDEADVVTRWVGTNTDIHDQKMAAADLVESQQRTEAAMRAADIGIWDFDPRTGILQWDDRCYELFGLTPGKPLSFDVFLAGLHPDDREATKKACLDAFDPAIRAPYDIEYRTIGLEDGVERWVSTKGKCSFKGNVAVRFVGTIRDISDLKKAEAHQRLLTEELEHRIKNTMAMVAAIASQTFRSAATLDDARANFDARLHTLSHAHDILTRSSWSSASMPIVVDGALAPHRTGESRIRVSGPDAELSAKQALSLALALHELATNAAKYGALSVPGGTIAVTWGWTPAEDGPMLRFEWRESGGPPVSQPTHRGFGSRLIEQALKSNFGGNVSVSYDPGGLVCRFESKLASFPSSTN